MSLTQYYTATTLDGFIADPDNSLDWLFTRKREDDGPLNYGAGSSCVSTSSDETATSPAPSSPSCAHAPDVGQGDSS